MDDPGAPRVVPPPRRALVTRLRRIGDAILTLPVVDALRAAFPECGIDYLAEEDPAQAAIGHPAIDRVFVLGRAFASVLPASPGLLATLRSRRYDWVIDLYGNPRSALLSAWTGAPVRIGPARRGRRWLYTHSIPAGVEPRTAVAHHLGALEVVGLKPWRTAPRIHLNDVELAEGRARLDSALPPGGPRVGVHAGNRWPAKRWPEERFAALLRSLSLAGARGVLLAGPGEEEHASRVAAGAAGRGSPPVPIFAGLPLRAHWGLVAALDALVTNDGSPLHAGPALGVPTVGILGPTEPWIWFPYAADDGHQLLSKDIWCRPCHRHECARMDCLHWIGVAEVSKALTLAIAHRGEPRATA